jgi:hypothetical protein
MAADIASEDMSLRMILGLIRLDDFVINRLLDPGVINIDLTKFSPLP